MTLRWRGSNRRITTHLKRHRHAIRENSLYSAQTTSGRLLNCERGSRHSTLNVKPYLPPWAPALPWCSPAHHLGLSSRIPGFKSRREHH